LTSKEIGKFHDIVDIVTVFHVVRLVDHANIIEDVVFTNYELEENNSNWPYI
jgi:hypothetical protein